MVTFDHNSIFYLHLAKNHMKTGSRRPTHGSKEMKSRWMSSLLTPSNLAFLYTIWRCLFLFLPCVPLPLPAGRTAGKPQCMWLCPSHECQLSRVSVNKWYEEVSNSNNATLWTPKHSTVCQLSSQNMWAIKCMGNGGWIGTGYHSYPTNRIRESVNLNVFNLLAAHIKISISYDWLTSQWHYMLVWWCADNNNDD